MKRILRARSVSVPDGRLTIAQRGHHACMVVAGWRRPMRPKVPEGRLRRRQNAGSVVPPGLLTSVRRLPSTEVLGYYQPSLRDEQPTVASVSQANTDTRFTTISTVMSHRPAEGRRPCRAPLGTSEMESRR